MTKSSMSMDELEDYLFGRLTPAACRRFEERMMQDPALRMHIRKLEEGALALAMAAPQLRPPRKAWTNIQAGIIREQQPSFLWLTLPHWLLQSWPLAGGLAVAVLIYIAAVHMPPPGQATAKTNMAVKQTDKRTMMIPLPQETQFAGPENSNVVVDAVVTSSNKEVWLTPVQVANNAPVRNRVLLAINTATVRKPQGIDANHQSPGVQYTPIFEVVKPAMTQRKSSTNLPSAQTYALAASPKQTQVDFVELSNPAEATSVSPTGLSAGWSSGGYEAFVETTSSTYFSPASGATVLTFPYDDDMMMFFDPTEWAGYDGWLTIWAEDVDGYLIFIGSATVGTNPMVINIQNAGLYSGYQYIVTGSGTNVSYLP